MTTEKMPDVIWAEEVNNSSIPGHWFETQNDGTIEYLRAEPVEELLKQVRDAMKSGNHNYIIGGITAIDKFLGDK